MGSLVFIFCFKNRSFEASDLRELESTRIHKAVEKVPMDSLVFVFGSESRSVEASEPRSFGVNICT